jgi:hypothetical protein
MVPFLPHITCAAISILFHFIRGNNNNNNLGRPAKRSNGMNCEKEQPELLL